MTTYKPIDIEQRGPDGNAGIDSAPHRCPAPAVLTRRLTDNAAWLEQNRRALFVNTWPCGDLATTAAAYDILEDVTSEGQILGEYGPGIDPTAHQYTNTTYSSRAQFFQVSSPSWRPMCFPIPLPTTPTGSGGRLRAVLVTRANGTPDVRVWFSGEGLWSPGVVVQQGGQTAFWEDDADPRLLTSMRTVNNNPANSNNGLQYWEFDLPLLSDQPKDGSQRIVYLNFWSTCPRITPYAVDIGVDEIRDGLLWWASGTSPAALSQIVDMQQGLGALHCELRAHEAGVEQHRYFFVTNTVGRLDSPLSTGNVYENGTVGFLCFPRAPWAELPTVDSRNRLVAYQDLALEPKVGPGATPYMTRVDLFRSGRLDIVSLTCWLEEGHG